MSASSSTAYDAGNEHTAFLFIVAVLGLAGVFFACRVPFWISHLSSDRASQGWRLAGHSAPRRAFDANHARRAPAIRHVSPVIAHLRTFYNTWLLPTAFLGITIGQCCVLAIWIALVVAGLLYESDLSKNPKRAGHIALAHLPAVFALAVKNSPVSLLGKSYVQVNLNHRLAGRTLFVAASIHSGYYLVGKTYKQAGTPTMRLYGIAAMSCLALLVVSSLRPVRRAFFQAFAVAHILGIAGFLVCVVMHTPEGKAQKWVYIAAGLFGVDVLLRVFNTRVRSTRIMTEGGQFSRIRIEGLEHGWRAGQHVRIRVRKDMLGFEAHPFTIANAPSTGFTGRPRGLIMHAHAAGDWTKKLRHTAYTNSGLNDFDFLGGTTESKPMIVKATVEGPYGGLMHRDLTDSESALVVCGGSGITFGLALLEDAVGRASQDRCRTENIVFCWTLRDPEMLSALSGELSRLNDLASQTPGLSLWMRIHLTGAKGYKGGKSEVRGATMSNERPNMGEILKLVLKQTLGDNKRGLCKGGIFVAAAGPQPLIDSVRKAASSQNYSDAVQAGGLVVHCESFGL